MSDSAEKVFRQNFAELVKAIDSPTKFAIEFHAEGLISHETRDAVTEVGKVRLREEKVAHLVHAVERMVQLNPEALPRVIKVLRRHVTSKHLADQMAADGNL